MSILSRAEAYWRAIDYVGSGDLLDGSGNGHDAQLGSTAGADTNDPLFLPHTGTQYLDLPGATGNYASTPDAAALDITGDIDLRAAVALTDWTPAGARRDVLYKHTATTGYSITITPGGILRLRWGDGTALVLVDSTVAPSVTDGALLLIRATLDVDNGASGRDITFYTKTSTPTNTHADLLVNTGWTQLGSVVTGAGTTSIVNSTAALTIGVGFGSGADGKFYAVTILDGINGTVVFDADFTDRSALTEPFATFTEKSSNAATVTINRSATGRKSAVVDRPMFLLGTDDYFEVADHANLDFAGNESLTVVGVFRTYDKTPAANMVLVAKKDDLTTAAGYALYNDTTGVVRALIADGALDDEDDAPAITDGQMFKLAGVRDVAGDDVEGFTDGVGSGTPVTDSTTATLANALPLRIGATSGTAASFFDGEFMGAAIFREALSDAEILIAGVALITPSTGPSRGVSFPVTGDVDFEVFDQPGYRGGPR